MISPNGSLIINIPGRKDFKRLLLQAGKMKTSCNRQYPIRSAEPSQIHRHHQWAAICHASDLAGQILRHHPKNPRLPTSKQIPRRHQLKVRCQCMGQQRPDPRRQPAAGAMARQSLARRQRISFTHLPVKWLSHAGWRAPGWVSLSGGGCGPAAVTSRHMSAAG